MIKREKIIVTVGEFDPLSKEELDYLKRCRSKGDLLIVGVHSDMWMQWCRGSFFQNFKTRRAIIDSMEIVDETFEFDDSDGTVCNLLQVVKLCFPDAKITYVSEEDVKDMPESKIKGIKFETMKQEN